VRRPTVDATLRAPATMADSTLRLDLSKVAVARSVFGGRNVAAVGAVGCEKSTPLTLLVRAARPEWGDSAVLVLAWAASEAQLAGGRTVSSLMDVSVGDVSKERKSSRVLANPGADQSFRETSSKPRENKATEKDNGASIEQPAV